MLVFEMIITLSRDTGEFEFAVSTVFDYLTERENFLEMFISAGGFSQHQPDTVQEILHEVLPRRNMLLSSSAAGGAEQG